MKHPQLLSALSDLAVVPVIEIAHPADAVPLARALVAGGLPVAEVTLRTPDALQAIRAIAEEVPGLLIGAGTVLSAEEAASAADAGAQFLVAPGMNPAVLARAGDLDVPMIPGVATPTEVEWARALGFRLLKLFPAEHIGGRALLRALAGPYRDVRFMPTGGITPANLQGWLSEPAVVACGGSWIASAAAISGHRWDEITEHASHAVALAKGNGQPAAAGQVRN